MRENAVKAYNALGALADEKECLSAADPPAPGSKPYRPVSPSGGAPHSRG
jgi:hypothetical protein